MKLAGVEAGGTSFKVAIATNNPTQIVDEKIFATHKTDPQVTLDQVIEYLKSKAPFDGLGIASFGPVDLNKASATFGHITTTPKQAYQMCNILGTISNAFPSVPVKFDTDVNAPALAEIEYGKHASTIQSVAYITVGTGIGVGLVIGNKPVHGMLHPEAGHIYAPICEYDIQNKFVGTCPFHTNCIEGMAASAAIAARGQVHATQLDTISDDHPVWDATAHYLAHLCHVIMSLASVDVIVVGGGVFNRACLLPKIHCKFLQLNKSYVNVPQLRPENIDKYIVKSVHGNNSGIVGALQLAKLAIQNK